MKKIKCLLFACLTFSLLLLSNSNVQAQSSQQRATNLKKVALEKKAERQLSLQQTTKKKTGINQKGKLKAAKKVSQTEAQSPKTMKAKLVKKNTAPAKNVRTTKADLKLEDARLKLKERIKNRQ